MGEPHGVNPEWAVPPQNFPAKTFPRVMARPEGYPKDEVYWATLTPARVSTEARSLTSDLQVPVVIIGGGMAGLMCAQRLLEKNVECVVLERSRCGSGATGHSSGFITPDSELELADLLRTKGPREAKRLWDFALDGIRAIRETIHRYGLACDHRVQDSLFVASSASKAEIIGAEHEAHQRLGYASKYYSANALAEVLGSRRYHGAMRTSDTFGICASLYCQGLTNALEARGVRIYEETPARLILEHRVETDHHVITAGQVIVCTDRFLPELGIIPQDIYHAQTFLAVSRPLAKRDLLRLFPEKPLMVWDTDLIYQYYRLVEGERLLLGASSLRNTYSGGETHRPRNIFRKMIAYIRRTFPGLEVDLEYSWPGLIGVSKDFLPLAGKHADLKDLYFAGGGAGLPWAAGLGIYVADKAIEGRDDFDAHFSQNRSFPIGHGLQTVLSRPVSFALSHGVKKYLKT